MCTTYASLLSTRTFSPLLKMGWETAALLAGPAIGSMLSSMVGASSAKDQMRFQRQMSSSAHQREVADLKKAGLNPILSAHKGASTPPGTQFTPTNPFEGMAQSAMAIRQADQAVLTGKSQAALNNASATKQLSETLVNADKQKLIEQQIKTLGAQAGHFRTSAGSIIEETKKREFWGNLFEAGSELLKPFLDQINNKGKGKPIYQTPTVPGNNAPAIKKIKTKRRKKFEAEMKRRRNKSKR